MLNPITVSLICTESKACNITVAFISLFVNCFVINPGRWIAELYYSFHTITFKTILKFFVRSLIPKGVLSICLHCRQRYITGSFNCSLTSLSKFVTSIFSTIKALPQSYCVTIYSEDCVYSIKKKENLPLSFCKSTQSLVQLSLIKKKSQRKNKFSVFMTRSLKKRILAKNSMKLT